LQYHIYISHHILSWNESKKCARISLNRSHYQEFKPDWSIGPQSIVLGLTITSARQFIELNSRYSCERSSRFVYRCLFIAPSLFRFLSFAPSTFSSRVILPRIAVVIENEVDLIERTSYFKRRRCAHTRFASFTIIFSEWRNYTAKMMSGESERAIISYYSK